MKPKVLLILVLFWLPAVAICQSTDIINKVADQSAENTLKELKALEQDDKKRIIAVIPFLSSDGKYTTESKEFTKKYVELLNKKNSRCKLKICSN